MIFADKTKIHLRVSGDELLLKHLLFDTEERDINLRSLLKLIFRLLKFL